jgi:hypothetical protein
MTVSAMRTAASPINVLGLAVAILLSIFAISLPFVAPDPGSRDGSELTFIGP